MPGSRSTVLATFGPATARRAGLESSGLVGFGPDMGWSFGERIQGRRVEKFGLGGGRF